MKCALAALGFINENIQYNKEVIIKTMAKCSKKADIVIFGEAFLQGFYGINFLVEHDSAFAVTKDDLVIKEICATSKKYNIAVSFGFIEKFDGCFYSSQITIDSKGFIIDIYRRVSPGWKEKFANEKYQEGKEFHTFIYMNKKILVGLCGDLWIDDNINKIMKLSPDIIFWPVYVDFNYNEWNKNIKYEYAKQVERIASKVLYVNSICKDKNKEEYAQGGAALFNNGKIIQEVPAGEESILFVEV